MAQVPAWADLVSRLSHLDRPQIECYQSVHYLLDRTIPNLDQKISSLSMNYSIAPQKSEQLQVSILKLPRNTSQTVNMSSRRTIPKSISSVEIVQANTIKTDRKIEPSGTSTNKDDTIPVLLPAKAHIPRSQTHSELMCFSPPPSKKKTSLKKKPLTKPKPLDITFEERPERSRDEIDLDKFQHLRSLPLPLSEYLKRNRPDVVHRANQRKSYILKAREKRKLFESSKIINSFERFKLSSRTSLNSNSHQTLTRKQEIREYVNKEPKERCKLTEQEMRRLTAKTYKRLPEVKRRRKEEMTNHIRVQNYKNKLEYGRKLLENRRRGIIDYPLKSSCEDTSIVSSQDDSVNGYGPGSLDTFNSDPFF